MQFREPLIRCCNVTKRYKSTLALNNFNFELGRGKIMGLLGPNGSGKTTLIKLINGLLVPDSGTIEICGYAPGVESKSLISYLPDKSFLDPNESVEFAIRFYEDFYMDFRRDRALSMLANLNINLNVKIKTLSKGNQEKVALILVMSRDAHLYLLDEPIAGVDPAARSYILNTIISNYNENATIILSTHLIADIEPVISDVIFVSKGEFILGGDVDDIRERENMSIDNLFREVFKC